jgi:hypothetical protein
MNGLLLLSLSITLSPLTPEERAIAYLAREVPRWSKENKCYSCHNNGDAARALYVAKRQSFSVPTEALADTSHWLSKPTGWANNGGDTPNKDKTLARIQFTSALIDAIDAGQVKDKAALEQAAKLVAEEQRKDGSWQIGSGGTLGAPASHGDALATHFARRALQRASPMRYKDAIASADRWLRKTPVKSVLDAAAVLLGLEDAEDPAAVARRKECLAIIKKGEEKEGGWGPYATSTPEPFDTAVVLLALTSMTHKSEHKERIRRGRAYLLAAQQVDGSWPETTRPAGASSYAERISTTGWATLALLATQHRMN